MNKETKETNKLVKPIVLTDELYNILLDKFNDRLQYSGIKGKKRIELQHELMIGALGAIDIINGNGEKSCIPPHIYFAVIRGEELKTRLEKIETKKSKK